MASIHDNVADALDVRSWAEFTGKLNSYLWPALKDRLSPEQVKRLANDKAAVIQALRKGFIGNGEENLNHTGLVGLFAHRVRIGAMACNYPAGFKFRSIEEQLIRLGRFFPTLRPPINPCDLPPLPTGAEACFVFPDFRRVGPHKHRDIRVRLCAAVKKMLQQNLLKLGESCRGDFAGRSHITPNYLRIDHRTDDGLNYWRNDLHDYIICPGQVGMRHAGSYHERVLVDLAPNEFCLTPFEVRCLLITHPELQGHYIFQCCGVDYRKGRDTRYYNYRYFNSTLCIIGEATLAAHEIGWDYRLDDPPLYTPTCFISK